MRVAIFTETFLPKVDGIVTVICLLLDHLAERGVDAVVIAPHMGDVQAYGPAQVIRVRGVTMPLYPELKFGPSNLATYRDLRAFQPDVAHFFHPLMLGTTGMLMAKLLGVPTLASFHLDMARLAEHFKMGFMRPSMNLLTRLTFNWADYALAPSRLVQREMRAIGVREVGLWRRGVDAERFNPCYQDAAMRARLSGGHPDETILLYVGRLSAEKQLQNLRPVLDAVPGTRLALVGDGPVRSELEAVFTGTPTQFMGYMQGEALSQAYASADIFVFPSALETFGLVVVEAMAAGLPVVASRVGGVTDVVDEGVTGTTFDVDDVDALIDGVRQIAADKDHMRRMGQDARVFAETQTWPAMMDEVIDHYARLIAARG